MVQTGKSYEIFSADGTRPVRASNTKSSRCNKMHAWTIRGARRARRARRPICIIPVVVGGGEEDPRRTQRRRRGTFLVLLFSGSPGAYRLHGDMHGGNTLFFLGKCYPAEWVVWDVGGKTDGAWERLELRWQEGGKKFTISRYGGQHVRWKDADGVFRGTSESKATEFVLKEKISSATGQDASSTNGSSSSSSSSRTLDARERACFAA
ncbi:unnamed protein product [Ectocarpus sp. CCAP 1310/34]|nr:unnamed protein product [Ectocarpus sp. CCAP 1310/34]